ncbi:hypothetical protein [Culicoidibacter larvae]|uniref:Uncharacterized protein n=1 Tax=Culicoidibacter larvae TaxID=2579976 RepID=A0A5R8QBI8_9FIRM|nr:hypothetical protein [Culicoidibacter larvae]TLG73941.1 hypothetical protein FEZ08_07370 [Culicoidibacter larvae]
MDGMLGVGFLVTLIVITLILAVPTWLVKNRYKKFTKLMREEINLENVMQVPVLKIKELVDESAHASQTGKVKDQAYDAFLDKLIKEYLDKINAEETPPRIKAKQIGQFRRHIDIGLDTPALDKLTEAEQKLEGKVSV